MIILGDGVDDATRSVVRELCEADARVSFDDRPKGSRHGEAYRDEIVRAAPSEYVFYLSDDDLWMPEHVETIIELFEDVGADAVGARAVAVEPDGTCTLVTPDLASAGHRDLMRGGFNRIGLSAFAHTRAAYERLPDGWRTTPAGIPTDLYMWQQWLDEPWPRFGQAGRPTVLGFPSSRRKGVGNADRVRELEEYLPALTDPSHRLALLERTIVDDFPRESFLEVHYRRLEEWVANRDEALVWHQGQLEQVRARLEDTEARLEAALQEIEELRNGGGSSRHRPD